MKPLLVGEQNPYGADPRYALYPAPAWSVGAHLCRGVLGLTAHEYLRAFDRVDLVAGRWSLPQARLAAAALVHPRRVLLGARVCAAHGVPFEPFHHVSSSAGWWGVVLPHPSGRSRFWNDPRAVERARSAVRKLLMGTEQEGAV